MDAENYYLLPAVSVMIDGLQVGWIYRLFSSERMQAVGMVLVAPDHYRVALTVDVESSHYGAIHLLCQEKRREIYG